MVRAYTKDVVVEMEKSCKFEKAFLDGSSGTDTIWGLLCCM